MANQAINNEGKAEFNSAAVRDPKDATKRNRVERKSRGNAMQPINSRRTVRNFHHSEVQGAIPKSKIQNRQG